MQIQPWRPDEAGGARAVQELKVGLLEGRDPLGRKLRPDLLVLLSGVFSFPYSEAEVSKSVELEAELEKWTNGVTIFLQSLWGDNLKTIVRHRDEAYPHVHASPCSNRQDRVVLAAN